MATFNPTVGAPSSLAFSGLSTLAANTYVRSTSAYTCNTNKPMNVVVEVNAETTNTPGTNKQLLVFIQESLDGTTFRSGPTSGTSTVREPNLKQIGYLPLTGASTPESATFDILSALGYIPHSFYVVIKNDLNVALTAGTVRVSEIAAVST